MSLGRLTKKATLVITNVSRSPRGNYAKVGKILEAIIQTSGMGTSIINDLSKLSIDSNKKVDLNLLVETAYGHSVKFKHSYVGTEHLLLALLEIFAPNDYEKASDALFNKFSFPLNVSNTNGLKKSPILEAFGINITQKFLIEKRQQPVDRDEVNDIFAVLLQRTNSNAMIVGEPGVGKRTIVELIAHKINNLEIPPVLMGYQVIEFDFMKENPRRVFA